MTRPRYEHVAAPPEGLRWDSVSPPGDIQLEYGGSAQATPHGEGAPFKRVRNTVTGRTTCFALAASAEDQNTAARAFESLKAQRAEQLNATRAKRSPRRSK